MADQPQPDDTAFVEERLTSHNARQLSPDRSTLNAYRADVLLIPTTVLDESPGVVGELNRLLETAAPDQRIEGPARKGPAGGVTGLRLRGDAREALKLVRDKRAVATDAAARAVSQLSLDRLQDVGTLLKAAGSKQGHGDAGLVPVKVFARAPEWGEISGRRPVVALLDTGVDDTHPWLRPAGPGSFVVEAPFQAQARGVPMLGPAGGNGPFAGHGTFLAGLVRQVAPQVQVWSLRVMHDDGIVYSEDFENALLWLHTQLEAGRDPFRIDVLCIAFGFRKSDEPELDDEAHLERLRAHLRAIAEYGVKIVASAGNHGCDCRTYPAALAEESGFPLVSVKALNPDGTQAHYSNHGDWVKDKAVGTGVISTMPADLNGDEPAPPNPDGYPQGRMLDPDNFAGGFARWSGTSFAAAVKAAELAAELVGTR